MRWFGMVTVLGAACLALSTSEAQEDAGNALASVEVPGRFQAKYLKQRPSSFLVDPQGVLSAEDFREQLEFLQYHSEDSAIDLYVYVLKGDQAFPKGVESNGGRGVLEAGKPAVVVHYFMGRPERSSLFLCPELNALVSPAEQVHALETAVARAGEEALMSNQLGKFLVEMSIRIYWMENLLKEASSATVADAEGAVVAEDARPSQREVVLQLARAYGVYAGVGVTLLLALVLLRMQLNKRARFQFVDLEVEPRLGGPHAAGIGAVLSFASASLPPGAQRDKLSG